MPAGAVIGGLNGGILITRLGRKGAMMTCATMFAASYLLLVVAPNVCVLYVVRFCTGVCSSISCVVCPVYVAETASAGRRGLLGSCVQLTVTFGIMLVVVMGCCGSWRWISVSCLVLTSVWVVALIFIPETPAHYARQKKY